MMRDLLIRAGVLIPRDARAVGPENMTPAAPSTRPVLRLTDTDRQWAAWHIAQGRHGAVEVRGQREAYGDRFAAALEKRQKARAA
jgi:hypothetical protein